jgi:hypothetical protein
MHLVVCASADTLRIQEDHAAREKKGLGALWDGHIVSGWRALDETNEARRMGLTLEVYRQQL